MSKIPVQMVGLVKEMNMVLVQMIGFVKEMTKVLAQMDTGSRSYKFFHEEDFYEEDCFGKHFVWRAFVIWITLFYYG